MIVAPVLLRVRAHAVIRRHAEHLANLTAADQVANLDRDGEVACPDGFHEEQLLLAGHVAQHLELLGVDGEGLLAQHVLAGLERKHRVLEVVRVRRRDVDDVHVGVGHQLLIAAVGGAGTRNARLIDEMLGALFGRGRGHGADGVLDVLGAPGLGVTEEVLDKGCGG